MSGGEPHVAEALTRFERPVGVTQSFVVTCTCGWESQRTTDWRRSLGNHAQRAIAAALSYENLTHFCPTAIAPTGAGGACPLHGVYSGWFCPGCNTAPDPTSPENT